jgi:preprotein translocase subunit Sec61beta
MKLKRNPAAGPTSSAGLVRYFDVSAGGVEITPELVVGLSVFFIALEIALSILV